MYGRDTSVIRVVQVGLGPIGLKATRYLCEHPRAIIVGAVDIDPDKQGEDIGTLAGMRPLGLPVCAAPDQYPPEAADAAVVTTTSSLKSLAPLLFDLAGRGWNVVSTCEELSFPWLTHPQLSQQLDEAAWSQEISILGTGINPGFVMDLLPIALTGICTRVERIGVERVQDASSRRIPFQHKIGAGRDPTEFQELVTKGRMGHVGLTESMHMLADRLGWVLEATTDEIEPVIAATPMGAADQLIPAGKVTGLLQTGRGFRQGREVIQLLFRASVGEPRSFDRIRVEGTPDFDFVAEGGINGDTGTTAILVNSIPGLQMAPPGLLTMAQLPPVAWFGG